MRSRAALSGADGHAAEAAVFDQLVETQLDASYRLARLILRSHEDAQDATHDAFLSAWRNRGALRDHARVDAWFTRILVNACRDQLRRRARKPVVALDADVLTANADPAHRVHNRDAIGRAFENLNGDQRVVVVLRFYRDLPIEAIAQLTDTRPGTVKSRLHHALRRLRDALADDDGRLRV